MHRIPKLIPERIKEATEEQVITKLKRAEKENNLRVAYPVLSEFTYNLLLRLITAENDKAKIMFEEEIRRLKSPIVKKFINALTLDNVALLSLNITAAYFHFPHQNYVLEKSFYSDFKEVSLKNLCFRHLPKSLCCLIKVPEPLKDQDGDEFSEMFVYIGHKEKLFSVVKMVDQITAPTLYPASDDVLMVGFNTPGVGSFCYLYRAIPLDLEMTLEDACNAGETITIADVYSHRINQAKYSGHEKVIMSILAYLNSGRPDIREFRNEIKVRGGPGSKAIRADSDLSTDDLVLVGYNYMKEKLYSPGTWSSKAHLGWRYWGPGKVNIRLSYIQGSAKRWHNPTNTEGEEKDD